MCKRVFSVAFGSGLDSMSPARSWRSASHVILIYFKPGCYFVVECLPTM